LKGRLYQCSRSLKENSVFGVLFTSYILTSSNPS
jgi:hypothetical protein